MIDYNTAKSLKEVGFPQTIKNGVWFPYASDDTREKVYIPTLEELIEACGDKFINLSRDFFGAFKAYGPYAECGMGKTAIEAVANLYLVLNKK